MEQKLLVLALGTTGGEVSLAFKQQIAQRTANGFYYKILCLDTSDQLRRSGRVAPSEFVHLTTEEHYMENVIATSADNAQQLHNMIYPDFPPPPSTANGAGNIRYSAATLLALPSMQHAIRSNLSTLIGQLAEQGETKSRDISFAIVISAVGATGSGAVSLLIPLILEAASNAGIAKPNIDVFILHPVLNVSDTLLLANAEALYIELAAMQNMPIHNRYTGRKVILGSGGQAHTITRLEELERTAATLIRLTTDARYGITQPYWNALPNRGVLRGQEIHTLLPSHLSSATPITIGLANLSKQVIEVDTARLTSRLVFGTQNKEDEPTHTNTLVGIFNNFNGGTNHNESYRLLLRHLTEAIHNQLDSLSLSELSLRALNNAQKAESIRSRYLADLGRIDEEKPKIQPQAREFLKELQDTLNNARIKYINAGVSLTQLRNDYKEVIGRIKRLQDAANRVNISDPISEQQLQQLLRDTARGQGQARNAAIAAVQQNVESRCEVAAVQTATRFLNSLEEECQKIVQRIDTFINEATERFKNKPGWNANLPTLQVHNDSSLYISALSRKQDIDEYYDHVSIFAQSGTQQNLFSDISQSDPMALFRHELEQSDLVKHFFDGQYNKIFNMIEQHVERRVKAQFDDYPLMNVFEFLRPTILRDCLNQALGRAESLMPFSRGFATTCVEDCYVTASWNNDAQKSMLEETLDQILQKATLIKSEDPTEIVVFYLIDGLAITAINELTGRCLGAFLEQRSLWTRYNSNQALHGSMRGIPIYSSYDINKQVEQQGIVHRLYKAKQPSVANYTSKQVPELADPNDKAQLGPSNISNSSQLGPMNMSSNQNSHSQSNGEHEQTMVPPTPLPEQNP